MKNMVLNARESVVTVSQLNFVISKDHSISTNPDYEKRFSFTFDKRVIQPLVNDEIDTLPLTS
jgi:hypothetical protein